MGELRDEYAGRVEFVIVPAGETARRKAELEAFHLISRGHGLVAFDRSGEAVTTIAGHRFGRDEIVMALNQVLEP